MSICSDTSTVTASVHPVGVDESGLDEFGAISTGFKLRIDHPLMKNARTSPVWKYFKHFDPLFHPDLKNAALFANKVAWMRQFLLVLKLVQGHL